MSNKKILIVEAIDKIAKIAIESEDLEIIISSTAALKTLGILQQLGFVHVSIDQYADV